MYFRNTFFVGALTALLLHGTLISAQIVRFRLETTMPDGTPVDTVSVGDQFLLKTYTQQVGGFDEIDGPEGGGVFAAYLDISYEDALVSVASEAIETSEFYPNGVGGEFSTLGLLDDVGGFTGRSLLGPEEYLVFSLLMNADSVGELSFVGSESLDYPMHSVLVFGADEPILNEPDGAIDFGAVTLRVASVPEPAGLGMAASLLPLVHLLRRKRSQTASQLCEQENDKS